MRTRERVSHKRSILTGVLAVVLSVSSLFFSMGITEAKGQSSTSIKSETKKVSVGSKTFSVQTVYIPKGTPVTVGLAKGQVGATEQLQGIVKSYGAQAAINGTFFEAYGGVPDPYGNLIVNGQLAHLGRYGTTIGFKEDGSVLMDQVYPSITGRVSISGGRSQSFYATFVNRTPGANASVSLLFTPQRGSRVGFKGGIAVTVEKDQVVKKGVNDNVVIPKNGYVLVFNGSMKSMADRFKAGADVELNIAYKDPKGKELPAWNEVITAVGAGPRLVKDGKLSLAPEAEGFTEHKILTNAAARSGIAVMSDGSVLLATVPAATMKQWADIMKKLGAKQAMNLDGGASSGLYAGSKMLTTPGRNLSNTLVFGNQLKK